MFEPHRKYDFDRPVFTAPPGSFIQKPPSFKKNSYLLDCYPISICIFFPNHIWHSFTRKAKIRKIYRPKKLTRKSVLLYT